MNIDLVNIQGFWLEADIHIWKILLLEATISI